MEGQVFYHKSNATFALKLIGDVRLTWCVTLEKFCAESMTESRLNNDASSQAVTTVFIDLTESENLDSTTLGILAKLGMMMKKDFGISPKLYSVSEAIGRLIQTMGFAQVFQLEKCLPPESLEYQLLDLLECDDDDVADTVLEAHQTLSNIHEGNRLEFESLIETLEQFKKRR